MKINYTGFLKESFDFLVSQLPVVGIGYQIWSNIQKKQEIDKIASRLEALESNKHGSINIQKFGFESVCNWSNRAENLSSNRFATSNLEFEPPAIIKPQNDFYSEIIIRRIPELSFGNGVFGTSLMFTNINTGEILPSFFHLLAKNGQGYFTHTTDTMKELGWAEIPNTEYIKFNISRKSGITYCSINGIRIFSGETNSEFPLSMGMFVGKDNVVDFKAILMH